MNKTLTVLALLALAPCGGCAGIAFEPLRTGGATADASAPQTAIQRVSNGPAPRSCARTLAGAPALPEQRDASM